MVRRDSDYVIVVIAVVVRHDGGQSESEDAGSRTRRARSRSRRNWVSEATRRGSCTVGPCARRRHVSRGPSAAHPSVKPSSSPSRSGRGRDDGNAHYLPTGRDGTVVKYAACDVLALALLLLARSRSLAVLPRAAPPRGSRESAT